MIGSTENLLDLDSQIKLSRNIVVFEIAVPELTVAALTPGVKVTILCDASGMFESAGNLFNFELSVAILNRDESLL